MIRRSYEYYEVRSALGKKEEEVQYRGSNYDATFRHFEKMSLTVDENKAPLYLVRIQVLEVSKPGEPDGN